MKDLIDKLSSYNIFNYLFPGVVFSLLTAKLTRYNLIFDNLFIGTFAYYFIGLVISRIGSVFIEPILKWSGFVKFAEYKDFVKVSKTDTKLEVLSEANNMYRTIISLLVTVFILMGSQKIAKHWSFFNENQDILALIFLFFLFGFSYRKQTNYITHRINSSK